MAEWEFYDHKDRKKKRYKGFKRGFERKYKKFAKDK